MMKITQIVSLAFFFVFSFLCPQNTAAYSIHRVGDVINGYEYVTALGETVQRDFSISVGISRGVEYVYFMGKTGLGDAAVMVKYDDSFIGDVKFAISKAVEWSTVAKKNKADTIKRLKCFSDYKYSACEDNSSASEKNEMVLAFFSTNSGQETGLVIVLTDINNQFVNAKILIRLDETKKMLKNIEKIEEEFKVVRNNAKKQSLFK